MRLRIISGQLKGRYISISESKDFRPTLERTRESVAEIIKGIIPDSIVADICAGSGAMGIELLSRGASQVDFVEKDRKRAELIRKNVLDLEIGDRCQIFPRDVKNFLKDSSREYDIIFYDPPYDNEELKTIVELLINRLSAKGILVYEQRRNRKSSGTPASDSVIKPYDTRIFGDTVVTFFNKQIPAQQKD